MSRFLDELKIVVESGKGGDGAVSFRREKYVPKGGPDGGDGGDGGNVIIRVDERLRSLYHLKKKKVYKAGDGSPGSSKNRTGARGKDCVLYVPPGTEVLDVENMEILGDLDSSNGEIIVIRGGKGGYGNTRFASPINRAPRIAKKGEPGRRMELLLRLKLIADIGMVGFPNAGKSTLLSVLTNSNPRIGDYPFTTVNPNLGVMVYKGEIQYIIADIPGLIEGASKGRGLGIKFLKHIERTRALLFLIDLASSMDYKTQFEVLTNELSQYSRSLVEKPFLVVGNKIDILPKEKIESFKNNMFGGQKPLCISAVSGENLEELKDKIAMLVNFSEEIQDR